MRRFLRTIAVLSFIAVFGFAILSAISAVLCSAASMFLYFIK